MAQAIINDSTGLILTVIEDGPVGNIPAGYHGVQMEDVPVGTEHEDSTWPPLAVKIGLCTARTRPRLLEVDGVVRTLNDNLEIANGNNGIVLHDDVGGTWLLIVAEGAPTLVSLDGVSALKTADEKVAEHRAKIKEEKDKGKTNTEQRLKTIETILGL